MPSAYSFTVLLTYGLLWLLYMGEEFNPGPDYWDAQLSQEMATHPSLLPPPGLVSPV